MSIFQAKVEGVQGFNVVNGTPSDCVHVALTGVLSHKPDLVLSGINNGANMGDDTLYSGTVAAAMEGFLFGVPATVVVPQNPDLAYPRDEELPPMHPAREAAVEPGMGPTPEVPAANDRQSAPNLAMRRWGTRLLHAVLQGWWTTWRTRRERKGPII